LLTTAVRLKVRISGAMAYNSILSNTIQVLVFLRVTTKSIWSSIYARNIGEKTTFKFGRHERNNKSRRVDTDEIRPRYRWSDDDERTDTRTWTPSAPWADVGNGCENPTKNITLSAKRKYAVVPRRLLLLPTFCTARFRTLLTIRKLGIRVRRRRRRPYFRAYFVIAEMYARAFGRVAFWSMAPLRTR